MCKTTHTNSAALAGVARIVVAARRYGQASVSVEELEAVLEGVDVDALADPGPAPRGGVGRRPSVEQAAASLEGVRVVMR